MHPMQIFKQPCSSNTMQHCRNKRNHPNCRSIRYSLYTTYNEKRHQQYKQDNIRYIDQHGQLFRSAAAEKDYSHYNSRCSYNGADAGQLAEKEKRQIATGNDRSNHIHAHKHGICDFSFGAR